QRFEVFVEDAHPVRLTLRRQPANAPRWKRRRARCIFRVVRIGRITREDRRPVSSLAARRPRHLLRGQARRRPRRPSRPRADRRRGRGHLRPLPPDRATRPLLAVRASAADLKERIPVLHGADLVANVTYQSIMTLMTAASRMGDCPTYVERIGAYVDRAQQDDIRIVE